jgi:hypothetical protein
MEKGIYFGHGNGHGQGQGNLLLQLLLKFVIHLTKLTTRNFMNVLFIGLLLTPDMQYQLVRNSQWKKHRIMKGVSKTKIQTIPYEGKEYLGRYFEDDIISWTTLDLMKTELVESFETFFPEHRIDKKNIVIFNQMLIS